MLLARLIEFLEKRAGPKTVVILVMAILPFNALVFPLLGDQLETISGYRMLDTAFSYTPQELFAYLEAYGYSGRLLYIVSSWSIDFFYPLLYTFLLAFLLTLFLRRSLPLQHPLLRLQLIPFGMMFFDYFENGLLALLMALYPTQPNWLAGLASLATSLKWCFAVITFAALIFAIIALLLALTRGQGSKGEPS